MTESNARCHFPEHNTEYFKQLTAEQLINADRRVIPSANGKKSEIEMKHLIAEFMPVPQQLLLTLIAGQTSKWEQLTEFESEKNIA